MSAENQDEEKRAQVEMFVEAYLFRLTLFAIAASFILTVLLLQVIAMWHGIPFDVFDWLFS